MATEFKIVDIWIGNFASAQRFDAFFHEVGDPSNDDAPISEFGASQEEPSYDPAFVEREVRPALVAVEKLLAPHSFSNSYIENAIQAARDAGVSCANAVVLIWGRQIAIPRGIRTDEYDLFYIGRFECDPTQE